MLESREASSYGSVGLRVLGRGECWRRDGSSGWQSMVLCADVPCPIGRLVGLEELPVGWLRGVPDWLISSRGTPSSARGPGFTDNAHASISHFRVKGILSGYFQYN